MNQTDSPTNPERTAGSYTAGQRDKLISPFVGVNEWSMLALLRAFQKKIGSFQSATDWMAICILRSLAIAAVVMMILIGVTGFTKMWLGFRESMSESWGSLGRISEKTISMTEQPQQQNPLPQGKLAINSSHAATPPLTHELKTDEETSHSGGIAVEADENSSAHRHSNVGLHDAVSGLEYLLLAPLSFLILRSLSEYIEDLSDGKRIWAEMMHRMKTEPKSVKESEILAALEGSAVSGKTKGSLLDAKALTIGLLFAILATHLVGRIITGGTDDEAMITLREEGLIGIILLVVLGTLYFFVERLSESLKPEKRNSGHKSK